MWNYSTSLYEMQQYIIKIFEDKMRLHAKISDVIDLSYDDYMCLLNKIHQIKTIEEIDHYNLSILVCFTTSYKFNQQDSFYNTMKSVVLSMPQHYTRFILESLNTTCYDYQIDTFDYTLDNLPVIKEIIKIHANY
ncbi:MAG: hypothetical protein EGR71_09560 [Clostridiales bacterium]|nr:hypothetical protein [Clostridiales bacterium]